MTEIEQAQRFYRAMYSVPPEVRRAFVTLIVDAPPEVREAFMTVVRWQTERPTGPH
jgi:hypothetical protein